MQKYRVKFTVEDYYDYLGGSKPYISLRKRLLASIPDEFHKALYNLKFKKISKAFSFHTYYRVQFSVKMEENEIVKIFERRKNWCHAPENWSYKPIKQV